MPLVFAQQPTSYPTQMYNVTATVNYPNAGTISPGNGTFGYGAYVVFYETTNPGYSFEGWYLNGAYEGKLSSMPVTIYQNYQVIGVYSISVNYLTLSSNGPGALTESNGTVTTNTSAGTLSYGTGQTITINEYTSSGGTFSGWYLDGAYMGTSIQSYSNHECGSSVSCFLRRNKYFSHARPQFYACTNNQSKSGNSRTAILLYKSNNKFPI